MPPVTDPTLIAELEAQGAPPVGGPVRRGRQNLPQGYRPTPDGSLAPTPGGPADPTRPQAPPSGYRYLPDGSLEQIPGAPPEASTQPSESERTAAFLATRVQGGVDDLNTALRGEPGAERPSVAGSIAGIFNDEARNWANSPARRQVEDAQLDILDAALTLGTGAAYTREQIEAYRQSYFPSLTDDPATIAATRRRLLRLLGAARIKAGRSAPQIDAAIAALGEPAGESGPNPLPGAEEFQRQFSEAINAGRFQTPSEAMAFARELNPDLARGVVSGDLQNAIDRVRQGGRAIVQLPIVRNPTAEEPAETSSFGRDFMTGVGDVVQGMGNIPGLVSNPWTTAVNAATGSNFDTDFGLSLRRNLGLPEPRNNMAGAINQGGIGALSLAGLARTAAPYAAGAVQNALGRFGAAPLTDTFAGASAGGSGEFARQQGAGPVGQAFAALAGGAASLPVAMRTSAFMASPARVETPLTRAGAAENVTVNRAMVDPEATQRVTALGRSMVGGRRIQRDMARVGGQIEGRVERLGRGGEAMDENAGGEMVRRYAERSITNSGRRAKDLYDSAETAAEGVRVPPTQSLQVVDGVIAKLSETPETNAAELTFLGSLRRDLETDLSVGALRRIRTNMRKRIANGALTFGEDERTVLSVMDSAADDIAAGLVAAGRPQAVRLFREADTMYRDRMEFINNTLQRVVGRRNSPLPPGQVFSNFRAMATPRGNSAGMGRMIREMEPEEQADIAATLAEGLGRNNQGEFSTAHLVSQLRKLPRAARVNAFGERGARSLDNLTALARQHARVSRAMGGSPTGVANDWRSYVFNLILGGGVMAADMTTGVAVGLGGIALKGGRDALGARALMSPNIQGWLRSAPQNGTPRAISRHIARLGTITAREPAIAAEVGELQRRLAEAFSASPALPAAAEENRDIR